MAERFECPGCGSEVRDTAITITRHERIPCGDHDERPLMEAFVVCSWECAAVTTTTRTEEGPS